MHLAARWVAGAAAGRSPAHLDAEPLAEVASVGILFVGSAAWVACVVCCLERSQQAERLVVKVHWGRRTQSQERFSRGTRGAGGGHDGGEELHFRFGGCLAAGSFD
jgi:hypothetical protein